MGVWRSCEPGRAAWPLTVELTESIATFMWMAGDPCAAICGLLCSAGLLRVEEALRAVWTELFIQPEEEWDEQGVSLHLPLTKRAKHEYIPITDRRLLAILRRHRRRRRGHKHLFGTSYQRVRKLLQAAVLALDLPEGRFRTQSWRRGGATWTLQQTKSVEYVVVLGRWASVHAARRYLRPGDALLARHLTEMSTSAMAKIWALREQANTTFACRGPHMKEGCWDKNSGVSNNSNK